MVVSYLEAIFLKNIACNLQFSVACNLDQSNHKLHVFRSLFLILPWKIERMGDSVVHCRIRLIAQSVLRQTFNLLTGVDMKLKKGILHAIKQQNDYFNFNLEILLKVT